MDNIILASTSPRRKEILDIFNIPFKTVSLDFDETINKNISCPYEISKNIVYNKMNYAIKNIMEDGIIITADTIVYIDGNILGKPSSLDEAFNMINMLQGKKHQVFTGLCVSRKNNNTVEIFLDVEKTDIYMRKLETQEIIDYISTNESLDKAGGYAIQAKGSLLIDKIDGDYFNVVGLPIKNLYNLLKIFNINLYRI